MSKKTNKHHFKLFKETCREWADRFGLTGWEFDFSHEDFSEQNWVAKTRVDMDGRVATCILNKVWPHNDLPLTNEEIRRTARHEILHMLFVRVLILGQARYISFKEIDEAAEETVRYLEKFLDNQAEFLYFKPLGILKEAPVKPNTFTKVDDVNKVKHKVTQKVEKDGISQLVEKNKNAKTN